MKIRKLTAGVLAVLMAASMTSIMASAETTQVGITADTVTATAGGDFEINVNLTSVPTDGIMAFDFAVGYDSSLVTITSVTEGVACQTGAAEAELEGNSSLSGSMISGSDYSCFDYYDAGGSICATWATGLTDSQYWIDETGVLFTIKGTVNADVAEGTVIDFTLGGIDRDDNTDMIFGYNTDAGSVYYDDIATTNGSVTVEAAAEVTYLYGDVNLDGKITIADVILLNQYTVNAATLNDVQKENADTVDDGNLNAFDSLAIMRYLAHMITTLGPTA